MKCPICKFAKCRWIELKPDVERLPVEELNRIIDHNVAYIEMIYKGHQGSADAEERAYNRLAPYADELEKRKARE